MKQENIPVGCVPPASVAITSMGAVVSRGVHSRYTYPPQKEPRTRHTQPPKGPGTRHTYPGRDMGRGTPTDPVNRYTIVNTLPSRNFEEFTWKNSPAEALVGFNSNTDYIANYFFLNLKVSRAKIENPK